MLKDHYTQLMVSLAYTNADDHHYVLSPDQAVTLGADYLVMGRPFYQADDPKIEFEQVQLSINEGMKQR